MAPEVRAVLAISACSVLLLAADGPMIQMLKRLPQFYCTIADAVFTLRVLLRLKLTLTRVLRLVQIMSEMVYDGKKVDVWSGGCTLFVMLTGVFSFLKMSEEGLPPSMRLRKMCPPQIISVLQFTAHDSEAMPLKCMDSSTCSPSAVNAVLIVQPVYLRVE